MGNLGGFDFHLPGVAVCAAQVSHYEPFYTVDISDLATDSGLANTTRGESMDVNDDGFVVGWYQDANNGYEKPFFLTPIDGGVASPMSLDDGTTTFTVGHAIAMSETTGYDLTGAIIAGWVDDPTIGHLAAYWTFDTNNSSWVLNLVPFSTGTPASESQAITYQGKIAGFYTTSNSQSRVFYYTPGDPFASSPSPLDAGALGARDNSGQTPPIAITGFVNLNSHSHGFFFDASGGVDLHGVLPTGNNFDDSVALAMNTADDLVGYASGVTGSPPFQTTFSNAVYWSPSGSGWSAVLLKTAQPDPIDSAVSAVSERSTLNGDEVVDIVGDYATNTEKGVFYVVYDRTQAMYASYKLEPTTGTKSHPSLAMFPLASRTTGKTYSANGINNRSAIAGSYKPDKNVLGNEGFRPCLYVPNDFDNNGIPDIREILQARLTGGTELDNNHNWMLDWAENDQTTTGAKNMRAGLHAPGMDGRDGVGGTHTLKIANTRIVRLPMQIDSLASPSLVNDQVGLGNLVGGTAGTGGSCSVCSDFYDRIHEWGTTNGTTEQQREIIITVRNPHSANGSGGHNWDEIPAVGSQARQDKLDIIRTFASNWAHCIDYMQMGNEATSGAGEWATSGGTPTPISDLSDSTTPTFTEFLQDGVDWTLDQAEAARIGSALAGRPLRIIGPAMTMGVVNTGIIGDPNGPFPDDLPGCHLPQQGSLNRSARGMRDLAQLDNDNRMYFDLHMHYVSVAQAETVITNMTDSSAAAWGSGNWPVLKVVLEFSPKGNDKKDPLNNCNPVFQAWQSTFVPNMDHFFGRDQQNPDWTDWDSFIKSDGSVDPAGWEMQQYITLNGDTGFEMAHLLSLINNDGSNHGFTAVCYGPTLQGPDLADVFGIASLRGTQVKNKWINDPDDFTTLLRYNGEGYEEVITVYDNLPNFNPHGTGSVNCPKSRACPNCGF